MTEKKYVIDNAELMAEWDWDKNNELGFDPQTLTLGSGKKAWWMCSKGHEWQAPIERRSQGKGCPYCSGRCVVKGENDLQTVNPTLAKEWNYERNNGLTPMDIWHSFTSFGDRKRASHCERLSVCQKRGVSFSKLTPTPAPPPKGRGYIARVLRTLKPAKGLRPLNQTKFFDSLKP